MESAVPHLSLKDNTEEVVRRCSAMWNRQMPDRILFRCILPMPELEQFVRAHPVPECADGLPYPPASLLAAWNRTLFEPRKTLEDDSLPVIGGSPFDQGIFTALLGGEIVYLWDPETWSISSMGRPLMSEEDLRDGHWPEVHPEWLDRYRQYLAELLSEANGEMGIGPLITVHGLNFVVEMRGATGAYLDLMLEPERTRELMRFGHDINCMMMDAHHEVIPPAGPGRWAPAQGWSCPDVVGLSIDAYHLCRPGTFAQFGLEETQALIDRYGTGILHIHANGRDMLPEIRPLKNVICLHLTDEQGYPSAFEYVTKARSIMGDWPLDVACTRQEFELGLEQKRLAGGTTYIVIDGLQTVEEANRLVEKAKAYRAPKDLWAVER